MCLGIPGKVVRTFHEHDLLMGKVQAALRISRSRCGAHAPRTAGTWKPATCIASRNWCRSAWRVLNKEVTYD
jgi:hypothetical protein